MTKEQGNTTDLSKPVTYNLTDGFVEIKNENLLISDKARNDKILVLLTTLGTIFLSLSLMYKWAKADDSFYLIFGLILLIINLGLLWKWYKEFTYIGNSIALADISYFKLVNIKFSDTKVGLIKIKEKAYRRIKMDKNEFNLLSDYFASKKIKTLP